MPVKPLNPASSKLYAEFPMKIDANKSLPTTPQKTHLQSTPLTATTATTATPAAEASVATHLHTTSEAEAPFDSQRVAEIRQAIASGHFQINAEKIADRLIGDVRDFLAKNSSPR